MTEEISSLCSTCMAAVASRQQTERGRLWRRRAPDSPPAACGVWHVHHSCCRRCRAGCHLECSPCTLHNISSSFSLNSRRCPRHTWTSGCGICVWAVPGSISPGRAMTPGSWAELQVYRASQIAGWTLLDLDAGHPPAPHYPERKENERKKKFWSKSPDKKKSWTNLKK